MVLGVLLSLALLFGLGALLGRESSDVQESRSTATNTTDPADTTADAADPPRPEADLPKEAEQKSTPAAESTSGQESRITPTPTGKPSSPDRATPTREPDPEAAPRTVVITHVIDGDTVEVRGDGTIIPAGTTAKVRLLAIDSPEKGACFSRDATARLRSLLPPGSTARVERDDELKDRYRRYLLYMWNEDGVFVNESLVRGGHAKSVLYPPNDKYWPRISRAQADARQEDAGLWSACDPTPTTKETPEETTPDTSEPNRRPPGLPPGPPAGVPDLDCSDLSGPVWVGEDDPHRLDSNGDGIGCEAS
ncbi:thermonuclease family protein [Streptomyces sp. NPDC005805]|uniref:thermonuclease family protein n=1 Tax=Streptomyces sp. NPDC005805 TaxID=3157068 RepID=UPI0033C0EB17